MWWNYVVWFFQNLLHHISKTGTLQNSIRLQISFFDHSWQLVMWPPSQHPIAWTLTDGIIIILFFFPSWSNQVKFHFLDGPWSKVPASHTPFIFFSDVLVIIWLFWINYHIWNWALDPENSTHHHHHSQFCSHFSAIFWQWSFVLFFL